MIISFDAGSCIKMLPYFHADHRGKGYILVQGEIHRRIEGNSVNTEPDSEIKLFLSFCQWCNASLLGENSNGKN